MCKELKEIVKVEKKESFKESDVSMKIKEFLESEKTEFPTFALTSMIMDSFVSGSAIFKVSKEIENSSPLQIEFQVAD